MKTRRIILNLPIIVFGLATIYLLIGQKTGNYSLLNAYLGFFTGFMTLAYTTIYLIYLTYKTLFKKKRFDFYPIFSFGIIIWIFFSLTYCNNDTSEIILSAEIKNSIDNSKYKSILIELKKGNRYTLGFHDSHYGCRESGKYRLINDSLVLIREQVECMYQQDYKNLKIVENENRIYLYNELGRIDSTQYFEIITLANNGL